MNDGHARFITDMVDDLAYTQAHLAGVTKREIERLRKRVERTGKAGATHAIAFKTGTRLVRAWNGKSFHVLVCDDDLEFDGRHYASLSHIAREITGAHWSGPRFFGLKKRSGVPRQHSIDRLRFINM